MTSSTPTRNSRAVCVALCAVLMTSSVTTAAPQETDSEIAKGQAKLAQQAYASGRYDEAFVSFSAAHRLDPRPAFLFNLAQCQRRLGNLEASAAFYERYLAQESNHSAPRRRLARKLLNEVTDQLKLQEQERQRIAKEVTPPSSAPVLAKSALGKPVLLGEVAVSESAPLLSVPTQVQSAAKSQSIFESWWFWTGVGVLAVAAGSVAYVATRPGEMPTLGTTNLRGAR